MESVEEVYAAHQSRLWRALLGYCGDADMASDAAAETYAQALARGADLRDPAAWIWRTAFRVAAGLLANRRSGPSLEVIQEPSRLDSSLAEFLDLLANLSEQQRVIVVLRYAGGFTPTEIAPLVDSTPNSVRVQLHRAHAQLRQEMGLDRE